MTYFGLLALSVAVAGCTFGQDAPFCAFTVHIVGAQGVNNHEGYVELLDERGQKIGEQWAKDGLARFCDVGFGRFTVQLRNIGCPPTAISGLIASSRPQTLHLTPNLCDQPLGLTPEGCWVYLRFVSNDGKAVGGMRPLEAATNSRLVSDGYGRMFFAIGLGDTKQIRFRGERGEVEGTVGLVCDKVSRIEKSVRVANTAAVAR